MVVAGDLGRADTLTGPAAALFELALHVPVPLVDLALLQTYHLLQLHYLRLVPSGILLELKEENFILLVIFAQSFLRFLRSLDPVANHYSWNR